MASRFPLLLVWLLLWSGAVAAQSRSAFVRHLTGSVGLSNNKCYTVLKDSKGYVWIGTENGLNRYDGHKFQVFRNIPNDSTSIGGNTVLEMHEDNSGNDGYSTTVPYINSFVINNPIIQQGGTLNIQATSIIPGN